MPNPDGTPTQAELAAELTAINVAIASGASRVSYDGKSVDYRDIGDLYRIRDERMAQLGIRTGTRRTVAGYNGGFYP